MRWGLLLFILFQLNATGYAQTDTINQVDENGLKQGLWTYYGKDRPEYGYPPNGKIEEGYYKDNRKVGKWIKYHTDGKTPKLVATYKNNRPDGPYSKTSRKGTLLEKGIFRNGHYVNSLYKFFNDGMLRKHVVHSKEGNLLIDSTFTYRANNCIDSIEILHYQIDSLIVLKYDQNFCDSLISRKSQRLSRVTNCFQGQNEINFVYTTYEDAQDNQGNTSTSTNPVKSDIVSNEKQHHYVLDSTSIRKDPFILLEVNAQNKVVERHKVHSVSNQIKKSDYQKLYNEGHEIFLKGEFNNYQFWNGKVYLYDEDEILLKVLVYKNGKFHSLGEL